MVVQESGDNATFTQNVILQTQDNQAFNAFKVIASVDTRYVRLNTLTATNDDFDVEAVVFPCPPEINPFSTNSCNDVSNSILHPGVSPLSCGVSSGQSPYAQYTFAMLSANNLVPADRSEVSNPDSVYHHPSWVLDSLGNVFGVGLNTNTNEIFATASSNYGSAFFGQNAGIAYGSIGGGVDDLGAAGTVYRIDPTTGQASVFVQLPQQSTTFTHQDCEDDLYTITRTTQVLLMTILKV